MLRVELVLTFVLGVLIAAAIGYVTHQTELSEALEEQQIVGLRRAAMVAKLERRLEMDTLVAKSRFVAGGPDLYDAIVAPYPPKASAQGEGADQDQDAPDPVEYEKYKRHLEVHTRLLRYQKEFELGAKEIGRNQEIDAPILFRGKTLPDLFFTVDRDGVGLAALGKDLYKWYDVAVSEEYEIVKRAIETNRTQRGLLAYSFDPNVAPAQRPLYMVAVSPVRKVQEGDDVVGAVVVGALLNDGVAKRAQALASGLEALGEEGAGRAPQLAYFHNGAILGSSLSTEDQGALSKQMFGEAGLVAEEDEVLPRVEIGGDTYLALSEPLPVIGQGERGAGVVVLSNLTEAMRPLKDPATFTIFGALLILIIGVALILFFVYKFLRPIARLEAGIQEVLAGHKDHEFTYHGSNKTAAGLAQQLNLMSAYLQGKRMPDADDDAGSWGDVDGGGGGAQVRGVSMASLMGARPGDGDDDDQRS